MGEHKYSRIDDYCFSQMKTVDKKQRSYPWILLYFSDKLREIWIIKCARYLYNKETAFFMLIIWTAITASLFIFVALSEFIVITKALLYVVLAIICFFGYLWTGLLMKYYMLTFSLGICFIGCLVMEVLIELLAINGVTDITRSLGTVSLIITLIVMLIGICVMKDNHITTWVLLSTFIVAKITIMDEIRLIHLHVTLPPLLAYICILGGKQDNLFLFLSC